MIKKTSCNKNLKIFFEHPTLTQTSCPVSRKPWTMIFVGRLPLKPASWTWQMLNWRFILIQTHHLGIFKVESCCHELFSGGKKELGVHHLWEELIQLLFYFISKGKVKVISCFYFVIKEIFQKPPTSLSRGSKLIGLDRSYLMENPDYQKLRFTILKWAKPRADIYLLFMWSTGRSWIISFFAVRIWQFLLLCATWNASRLRWINNPSKCVTCGSTQTGFFTIYRVNCIN